MRRTIRLLALLAGLLLVGSPTLASIRSEPLRVHLLEAPRAAEAGRPYAGTLRLQVTQAGELGPVQLTGPGWQVEFAAPPPGVHAVGDVLDLAFVATGVDPREPLTFATTFDGKPWSRSVDLSPAAFEAARVGLATADDNPRGEYPAWLDKEPSLRPPLPGSGRVDDFLATAAPNKAADPNAAAATLTVTGQIGYTHLNTGQYVGAQNAAVAVFYSPPGTMFPALGALGTTDAYGDFSFTFNWPDTYVGIRLWVQFSAVNSDARLEHTDIWEDTWSWMGPIALDVPPGNYNFGRMAPRKESHQGALHIANTIARGNQVYLNYGYNLQRVDVQWAEGGDGSFYRREWNELHITRDDSFNESVILHEFSHYWMDIFAHQPDFDYCNDMCDEEIDWWFDDCGHCIWCEEDQAIAWNEGLPDFLSQILTDHIRANYSVPGDLNAYNFQSIKPDDRCPGLQTALRTEGYFAAALYDLHDASDHGEDDLAYPGWSDRLGGYLGAILQVASRPMPGDPYSRLPYNSGVFMQTFHDQYPAIGPDLWETLMNSGISLDTAAPMPPTGLAGLDHVVGVSSPDNTITVTWDAGVDDFSGIGGYSFVFNSGSFGIADSIQEIGPARAASSPPLAEGTWYFSLRVRDRAGNWSVAQANIGPFIIRAAEPADMAYEQPAGWQYPLVPRNDNTATAAAATVSGNLPGDQAATYWSVAGRNVGEALFPLQPRVALTADGVEIATSSFTQLGGGNWSTRVNLGPATIAAGRHTLGMFLDSNEQAAEPNELNNHWARQWVWLPPYMATDVTYSRPAPPERIGGFEHIKSGSFAYYNCDGFRTQYTIGVQAVWLYGEGTQTDYDLRLYDPYSLPDNGFQIPQELSSRDYGRLDAILIHGINDGLANHNLGVQNFSSSDRGYHVRKLVGPFISPPSSEYVVWQAGEMMTLRTISIPSGADEDISIILRPQPGSQPMYLAFYPADFVTTSLADAAQTELAYQGSAQIDVTTPTGSLAAVAVYRDPNSGTGPAAFTLECVKTPPDLVAVTPAGWYANIVPQPDNSIAYPFTTVPAPTLLTGFTNTTYLYMSEANQSIVASPGHNYEIRLDGSLLTWFLRSELTAGEERTFRGASPYTVAAGRHCLGVSLDADAAVDEASEDNNRYGEQWMWRGQDLELGSPRTYGTPPPRIAGFEDITTGFIYYNCLGAHTPVFSAASGTFGGVYLAPEPSLDADLRLHEPYTSMSDGFSLVAESSTWAGPECDFVIADFKNRPHQGYDVSVVNIGGSGDFVLEAVGSAPLDPAGAGQYGPFLLTSGLGLNLHEIGLKAGSYRFDLRPDGGDAADLGFSLHGAGESFYTKDAALAMAWQAPPEQPETFTVHAPQDGLYCLAVWKVGLADLKLEADYTLGITEVTGVADGSGLPARTRLVSAAPNPFNPLTTLRFELAESAPAVLEIYNTRGERVRELVRETLPAGRHRVQWDGRDGRGGRVASGIYYARLVAGKEVSLMKVTLLK